MPAAVDTDWEIIKQLYIQGIPPHKIEERTGVKAKTIHTRATRGQWRRVQAKVIEELRIHTPMLSDHVAKASIETRNVLANSLRELSTHIAAPKSKPRSLKQAVKLQADLEPAIRNAERIFGWSQQSSTTAFSSQVLSEAPPNELESPTDKPAIEVQSSPAE